MDREERRDRVLYLFRKGARVIALDGRAASGKSTLSEDVRKVMDVDIVHMDDFFLPKELRTPERFLEPGGNVHYERFISEVIEPLSLGLPFSYRVFSCSTMDYGASVYIDGRKPVIVEGSYALHYKMPKYWDHSFFLDVDQEEQISRLEKRCPEKLEAFRTRWIPLEEAYIAATSVLERADEIV